MPTQYSKLALIGWLWMAATQCVNAQTAYYHYEAKNQNQTFYFDLVTFDTSGLLSLNIEKPMWLWGSFDKSSGEWIFKSTDTDEVKICFKLNNKLLENIRFCKNGAGERPLPKPSLTWNKGNASFKILRLLKKQALIPEIKNSPAATYDVVFPDPQWPADPTIGDSLRKAFLSIYLGEEVFENKTALPALTGRLNQMALQYQEENRDIYDPKEYFLQLNHEFQVRPFIVCNTGYVLSAGINIYAYTGGAHGLEVKRFANLNLKNGRTIQLGHLFDMDNRYIAARLKDLIKTHIKKQYKLSAQQSLTEAGFFSDEIELPAEFYLTPTGIGFYYNVYEIAPYVMGPINVFVPWKEVKSLMGENVWALPESFLNN